MVKIGTVWDRTAEFLTDNLTQIVPIALLAYFVPFSIQGSFQHIKANASDQLLLVLELVSVGFGVLALWGSLSVNAMSLGLADGKTAGGIAARRLIQAIVVAIVGLVVVLLLMVPIVIALRMQGVDPYLMLMLMMRGGADTMPDVVSVPLAIYILALIPLCLWLAARFSFLASTVVVAEKKWLSAYARAYQLTRGLALRLIGVLLLYIIVSQVAILATKTVFGSIFQLVAGPADGGLSLSAVLTSVMVALVGTGFAVIAPAFTGKLYLAVTAGPGKAAAA